MFNVWPFIIFTIFVYSVLLFNTSITLYHYWYYQKHKEEHKEEAIEFLDKYDDKVIIIIPVRDDPSVLNSLPYYAKIDYPNFQVAIVDDSASEGFSELLRQTCDKYGFLHFVRPKELRKGRKGAAINYVLPLLEPYKPKYVVIMDADHRPPRDFLKRAVSIIKKHPECNAVIGHQRHNLGTYGLFGRFYRASQAASIISNAGRHHAGMAGFFGGSVSIFEYDWIVKEKFDPTSITEDWEISLRGYINGTFRPYVTGQLYAECAIPEDIKWFFKQQVRWAEGNMADFKKHFIALVKSRHIGFKKKIGLIYQGLFYFPSIVILSSLAVTLSIQYLPFLLSVLLNPLVQIVTLTGWFLTYAEGFKIEGMKVTLSDVMFAFLMIYAIATVYAYATLKGLLFRTQGWTVTKRRA